MSEPVFSDTAEDMWGRLPEHFQRMDALNDFSMKRYISGIAEQLETVDNIIDRIDYDTVADGGEPGATSELVDPTKADIKWLPWLGQLFGTYVRGTGQESDRAAVITASAGFKGGTPAAIEAAAQDVLVGTKFTKVYKFSNNIGIGAGDEWDLLLVTIDSETLINLYPEIQATVAETVSWDITAAGYTVNKKIVKTEQPVYNRSAMEISFTGAVGSIASVSAYAGKAGPITPTDWYQTMFTIWNESGATQTGTVGITFYNGAGTSLGTTSESISIDGTPKQVLVGANAPANSATASARFILNSGVPSTEKLYVAQLALRHEINDYWIPKTADPVQAVIDKGAKPAGFKLWKGSATTSWDDVIADNPTWDDWEAAGSWETLEES